MTQQALTGLARYHSAAKYNWRLGNLYRVENYIRLELQHDQMRIGIDHPDYALGHHILARVNTAIEDQQAYESAKQVYHLEEDHGLTRRWAEYESLQAQRQKEQLTLVPAQQWRLLNLEKALFWAQVELDRDLRISSMVPHVIVQWKIDNVVYLKNVVRSMHGHDNREPPYADIYNWLEVPRGLV